MWTVKGALVARLGRKDEGLQGVHEGLQERSLLNGVGHEGIRGGRLTRDNIRVQEEEEQEAKVCERERGQPRQNGPWATEQGGGK